MPPHANTLSDAAKARLLLVVLCIGWGTTWVTMRIALEEIPPFSMRVATLSLGALVLTGFALLPGPHARDRAAGAPGSTSAWRRCSTSWRSACSRRSRSSAAETSRVAIMVYTMPIWAAMLALPILGERLTPTRIAALALCVAGMAILIAPLAGLGIPVGIMLAIGAAMSWAAGTVYLKWAKLEGDPMAIDDLAARVRPGRDRDLRAAVRGRAASQCRRMVAVRPGLLRHHRLGALLFPVVRHRAAAAGLDRGARHPGVAGDRRRSPR